MVIGPTPPGTGVIAPATSAALAKSTSPTSLPSTRLMPTSITVAPGFSQSPLIISGRPDRGDEDVGAADDGGQVAGPAVGDGDGAVLAEQQLRHRLADDVRAADHHRFEAGKVAEPGPSAASGSPAACRGPAPSSPTASRPAFVDVEAVDVLGRVDRGDHRALVDLRRQRQLDEDAVDPLVRVELHRSGRQDSPGRCRREG